MKLNKSLVITSDLGIITMLNRILTELKMLRKHTLKKMHLTDNNPNNSIKIINSILLKVMHRKEKTSEEEHITQ